MTPGRKGAIAEAAIAAEAIRLGFDVYRPVSEGGRYDLIIDAGPRLLRAQCKWAGLREDVLVTRLSTSRLTPRGYLRTTYTAEEIDGVAAYCMALDLCVSLPIEELAGQSYLHLRIGPTRNGQRSGVKWRGPIARGCSSAGRASGWQPEGQGFEPPQLHWIEEAALSGLFASLGLDQPPRRLAPELLEAVVVARGGRGDVGDHGEVGHGDPARFGEALDAARQQPVVVLHALVDPVVDRLGLAVGAPGADDEVVRVADDPAEIDHGHVHRELVRGVARDPVGDRAAVGDRRALL